MDAEKDIKLEELFRKKLESTEVIPSSSFNSTLMKKLAHREFMSFNPARINIFYVGGMVAASIAAILILSLNTKEIHIVSQPIHISKNIVVNEAIDTTADQISVAAVETFETPEQPARTVSAENIAPLKNDSETIYETNESLVEVTRKTLEPTVIKKGIIIKEKLTDNRLASTTNNTKLFIPSALKGCAPFRVKFTVMSEKTDSCHWSFGGNGFSSEKHPEWVFTSPGDFEVKLEAFSSGKLTGVYTENITVYQRPAARFEISPEQAIIPDDEVRFINYSSGAVRYLWDFGDGSGSQQFETSYRYKKFGNYTVTLKAYNEYGCIDSVVMYDAFADSKCYIEFPNAFIPNQNGPSGGLYSQKSDEFAHVFHPVFVGVTDYKLKIFSKQGILIFESSDVNIGWDGYLNGQICAPGVYIWQASGQYRTGESFSKIGDVTLLNN